MMFVVMVADTLMVENPTNIPHTPHHYIFIMRKILFKIKYYVEDEPDFERTRYILSETLEQAIDYLDEQYALKVYCLSYEDLNNSFVEL